MTRRYNDKSTSYRIPDLQIVLNEPAEYEKVKVRVYVTPAKVKCGNAETTSNQEPGHPFNLLRVEGTASTQPGQPPNDVEVPDFVPEEIRDQDVCNCPIYYYNRGECEKASTLISTKCQDCDVLAAVMSELLISGVMGGDQV